MIKRLRNSFEHLAIVNHLLKWTILTIPVSFVTGSIVALFLWLLDKATTLRLQQGWLLYLLPVAGILIYFVYKYLGKNAEAGNSLITEKIHEPGGGVPTRMTPLFLITTVITHLFGGSAVREGTAVQVGGSMAGLIGRWMKLDKQDLRILLMCSIAAVFGAVFCTPVTRAIFALVLLAVGRINHIALMPCFIASILTDFTCTAYGIHHTAYHIIFKDVANSSISFLHFNALLLLKAIIAGVLFGLAGYLFSELSHTIRNYSNRLIKIKWLIPDIGGILIIGLGFVLGTITPDDKIKHVNPTTWQKMFPKSAFVHIIKDAKAEGILNASGYTTQYCFSNKLKMQSFSAEGDNSKLNMCVELVDERQKLEAFFIKHKDYLKDKVVIYKEVEFWDID